MHCRIYIGCSPEKTKKSLTYTAKEEKTRTSVSTLLFPINAHSYTTKLGPVMKTPYGGPSEEETGSRKGIHLDRLTLATTTY